MANYHYNIEPDERGDEVCSVNVNQLSNRPFQGSYRHIAGGEKTLGRARGHQWRPYYLLVSERKLPFEILPFFLKNVYISVFNSYFLDNRWVFSDMWPRFVTNQRTGSNKKRRLSSHLDRRLSDVSEMSICQQKKTAR